MNKAYQKASVGEKPEISPSMPDLRDEQDSSMLKLGAGLSVAGTAGGGLLGLALGGSLPVIFSLAAVSGAVPVAATAAAWCIVQLVTKPPKSTAPRILER